MANPAADARAKLAATLPAGVEIAADSHSIVYADGATKSLVAHVGRILNDAGGEIETDFTPGNGTTDAPYLWAQKTSNLHVMAVPGNADFGTGAMIQVRHPGTGAVIDFQPQQIQWTNDIDQIDPIADVDDTSQASVSGDTITWSDAYGPGIHFEWQSQTERARKLVTFDAQPPDPAAFIPLGGNPVMRVPFIFPISGSVDIYINDALWNERDTVDTASTIRFESGGQTIYYLETGKVWDDAGDMAPTTMRFRRSGNTRFLEVRIPLAWVQNATYPIYVDPSVAEQVGASSDDAHQAGTTVTINATSVDINNSGDWGAARWALSAEIPSGSTIDVCTMELNIPSLGADDLIHTHDFEDAADPGTFTTGSNDISGRTGTTATVSESNSTAGTGWHVSDSLVTPFQEVIDNQSGLASGAHVVWRASQDSGGTTRARSYDHTTSLAPKFNCTWTEPAAGAAGIMTTNTGYWGP